MILSWKQAIVVARKELRGYFGSPLALIFVGVFLAVTLFVFFWVDTFFSRNIADVRPLFRWMPILMIFLVATLTMRQWSEEQRVGTLEILLTLPVHRLHLVLGKLLAVLSLVAVALALTLILPITVSIIGDLDWGPVVGGYVATILMASAYAAIGLFVSARTSNQMVALIITVLISGILYLVGTGDLTEVAGEKLATVLHAIGIGSRFESIERGVIDARDLIYYLSVAALFVALNLVSVDMKRWGRGLHTALYRRNAAIAVLLVAANLAILNTWLFPLSGLRVDLTSQGQFSLSDTTRDITRNLQEPLLLRGYISERTHPLLEPLVPNIKDLMREYEIGSGGRIKAEVVDPKNDEELEAEANLVYGITPVPFRISERYETSVVNSYFDILVRYGDQFVILNLNDLIEIIPGGGGETEVRLRNLEFDLTSSIKRVASGFQNLDSLVASLETPIQLTAFVTSSTLPEPAQDVLRIIENVGGEMGTKSGGGFNFNLVDLDAPGSGVTRDDVARTYGISPYPVSLLSRDSYYFHIVLDTGEETLVIFPTSGMSEADVRSAIDSAIRRGVPGFLKSIGLWFPPPLDTSNLAPGQPPPLTASWNLVSDQLRETYALTTVDLRGGRVPAEIDALLVVGPQGMSDHERFAVDQFLMQGRPVVVATGNFKLSPLGSVDGLAIEAIEGGLLEMLSDYGVELGPVVVLDPQNEPFPAPVDRKVGDVVVREMQRIDYPFFIDIRRNGMDSDSPISADLPAVTLQWASPLEFDPAKNQDREVISLLRSTDDSWIRSSSEVEPDLTTYPELGFPVEGETKARTLAASIRGSFESFFQEGPPATNDVEGSEQPVIQSVILQSPESSRLVVIGSSEFLNDLVLGISRALSGDRYLLNLQFLQNVVDWSLEDEDLLSLRSRGVSTRILEPLDEGDQTFWEALNYGVALAALVILGVVWRLRQRSEKPMQLVADVGEEQ